MRGRLHRHRHTGAEAAAGRRLSAGPRLSRLDQRTNQKVSELFVAASFEFLRSHLYHLIFLD